MGTSFGRSTCCPKVMLPVPEALVSWAARPEKTGPGGGGPPCAKGLQPPIIRAVPVESSATSKLRQAWKQSHLMLITPGNDRVLPTPKRLNDPGLDGSTI